MRRSLRLQAQPWLLVLSAIWVLPAIWLASVGLCAAQDAASGTVMHLHGSVVNGATGRPIARALVFSADQRVATMTDTDGQFALDVTVRTTAGAGGVLVLTPRKPGFSQALQPTVVPLNAASADKDLELKLMPASSISGQVTANGEPAGEVMVSLLVRTVEEGQLVWRQRSGQQTDSRGEFRFSGLEPGEYTVATGEWRGDQPVPPRQQERKTITTEYPPDFAGDTASFDAATKVQLHYGDAPRVELHLNAAKYYPVTIPVAGSGGGVNVRVGQGGGASFNGFTLAYNSRDRAVEGSLPDGDYTLLVSASGATPSYAEIPIHIADAPFASAPVTLAPGQSIRVRVEKQFTQPDGAAQQTTGVVGGNGGNLIAQPVVQIILRSQDSNTGVFSSKPAANGELAFGGVAPGQYTVQAFAYRGYIASLSSGGVDLLEHPLAVSAGGSVEPMDLVVRDDTGSVTGTVKPADDARPLPQTTFLALIPQGGAGIYTQGAAGPDGKFQVSNVAPGTYRILAFRGNFQQIAYRDPKAREAWNGKGATVTVTAGAAAQVDVPLLDEAEAQPE